MTTRLIPGRGLVAVDLGNSSGRVILGRVENDRLETEEVHRFPNGSVRREDGLFWDIEHIEREVDEGLRRAARAADGAPLSIGFDSFGVDFVLLDGDDRLSAPPRHMRDPRTQGVYAEIDRLIDPRTLYARTGTVAMEINTAAQLFVEARERPAPAAAARSMLFVPDYLAWRLTGLRVTETTIAATSQLLDPVSRGWARDVAEALGVPGRILNPLVEPGTVIGPVGPDAARRLGLAAGSVVAAAGAHDTAAAVAAAPITSEDSVFISLGTWALLGRERRKPDLSEASRLAGLTNECGVDGRIVHHKILPGLWLIQECLRIWLRERGDLTFADLHAAAEREPEGRFVFDATDPRLTAPENMPEAIRALFVERGSPAPEGIGATTRAVYDSLAVVFSRAIADIAGARPAREVHIVGGGAKAPALCRAIARAAGVTVTSGPEEATSLGNLIVQLLARGEIASLEEGRALVAASCPVSIARP